MNVLSNPIVVGVLIGAPTSLLAYLGYRKSKKADKVTEKAAAIEQVIDGLNKLVDNLQDDNSVLRDNVKDLRDSLLKVTGERDTLKDEIYSLKVKYGQTTE